MKIVLGTVQFGLEYGINNSVGRLDRETIFQILNRANELGIQDLDTADHYGDALDILGEYHQKYNYPFKIMSKFVIDNYDKTIESVLGKSLTRLCLKSLEAYFFHRFDDYKISVNLLSISSELKSKGLIKKIGVSLYTNEELECAIKDPAIDIIQLPFNIFDSDSVKINLLRQAKIQNKEVHVRSIFLQGLFYKDTNSLTGNLINLKNVLEKFHELRKCESLSVEEVCFGYVNSFDFIDALVIGVDDLKQLEKNIKWSHTKLKSELVIKLQSINSFNKELLNPSSWKK